MPTRRISSRPPVEANPERLVISFLSWSILILLLVAAAVASWLGSFYIFGHPEEAFSYNVLKTLGKLEPPKRFELTAAPRGEFLGPEALWERYSGLSPAQLRETNRLLIRNYIRNYQQAKDPVPYIIGRYVILDSYELSPDSFFPSGVVALAKAQEEPRILLEHVFPSAPRQVLDLQRMLLTGIEINLQRRLDMSAIVHVEKLRDGRLKFTAVPLTYGAYAAAKGSGTFSLEPPSSLNVAAGLPLVRASRLEAASEKYASFRRRAGLPPDHPGATARSVVGELLRVHKPEPVNPDGRQEDEAVEIPGHQAVASISPPPPAPPRVMPALPVQNTPPPPPSEPPPPVPAAATDIFGDLPPEDSPPPLAPPAAPATAVPTPPSPTPPQEQTQIAAVPEAIANVRGGNWQVFPPGRMPRGRLVHPAEMGTLADRGLAGERLYLQGNFRVTAASSNRAVLRFQEAQRPNSPISRIRVIVDFPAGTSAPQKGENISRDGQRPFLIRRVVRAQDGHINVEAVEITSPQ